MFAPGSRYQKQPTYTVTLSSGRQVTVVRLPLPSPSGVQGYHPRTEGQRLDHIAAHYLNNATLFWRLCDENNAVIPDALVTRPFIGIPPKGQR